MLEPWLKDMQTVTDMHDTDVQARDPSRLSYPLSKLQRENFALYLNEISKGSDITCHHRSWQRRSRLTSVFVYLYSRKTHSLEGRLQVSHLMQRSQGHQHSYHVELASRDR